MASTSTSTRAPIMEVFASIQGEGAYAGEAQVFLRLAGCPLRCEWCDTPHSWSVDDDRVARVVTPEGPKRHSAWANPFQVATWVAACEPREARTVSVTGGEPLMWPEFLLGLPDMLAGRRLHLETAGAHPEALRRVAPAFDHLSLDLKLPEDMGEVVPLDVEGVHGEASPHTSEDWTRVRREVLAIAAEHHACAKIVVRSGRLISAYLPLLEDLERLAPNVPLYLTPVSPMGGVAAPEPKFLEELVEEARDLHLDVRVMPQLHRVLSIP
ncbi:MAG: 7-carboxy-7-deazaguanine synthase QueE [Planctomycetota bacterium]|nr:7-carboxy-7-deazaguanine synthase QueE [Planctomycetota bacterium]MDP6937569.1 7-carboxy-7-deazaguanine synthase QueE [Planctomycetota bacterium]